MSGSCAGKCQANHKLGEGGVQASHRLIVDPPKWEISLTLAASPHAGPWGISIDGVNHVIATRRTWPVLVAQSLDEMQMKDALASVSRLVRMRRVLGHMSQMTSISSRFHRTVLLHSARGAINVSQSSLPAVSWLAGDNRPVWVSRQAARWGLATHSFDLDLEFDLYRNPDRWSGYILRASARALIPNPQNPFERAAARSMDEAIHWIENHAEVQAARILLQIAPRSFLGLTPLEELAKPCCSHVGETLHIDISNQPVMNASSLGSHQPTLLSDVEVWHGATVVRGTDVILTESSGGDEQKEFWPKALWKSGNTTWKTPAAALSASLDHAIYVGSSRSWYHFLVESCTAILECRDRLGREAPVIVLPGMPPQAMELCELLSGQPPILSGVYQRIAVSQLATLWNVGFNMEGLSAETVVRLLRLRRVVLDRIQGNSEFGSRIHVRRTSGLFRPLWNANMVERFLGAHSFRSFDPSNLTLDEQVRAFRDAKVIVAESGAALTNLMFCKPGTLVLQMGSAHEITNFWEKYAKEFGLEHRYVLGRRQCLSTRGLASGGWRITIQDLARSLP